MMSWQQTHVSDEKPLKHLEGGKRGDSVSRSQVHRSTRLVNNHLDCLLWWHLARRTGDWGVRGNEDDLMWGVICSQIYQGPSN